MEEAAEDITIVEEQVKEYKKLQAMIDELQEKSKEIKESIIKVMEEKQAEELKINVYKIRYVTVVSNRFNVTDFKKSYTDLYNEYLKKIAIYNGLIAIVTHYMVHDKVDFKRKKDINLVL